MLTSTSASLIIADSYIILNGIQFFMKISDSLWQIHAEGFCRGNTLYYIRIMLK